MRNGLTLVLATCFVAGCEAGVTDKPDPTAPKSEGATDVSFAGEALTAWQNLSADEKGAANQRIAELGGPPILQPRFEIAIAEQSAADDEVVVVREPGASSRQVIVFSKNNLTDASFAKAAAALVNDQKAHPFVSERRILHIRLNARSADLDSRNTLAPTTPLGPEETLTGLWSRLWADAKGTRTEHLDGVGKVHLVQLDPFGK